MSRRVRPPSSGHRSPPLPELLLAGLLLTGALWLASLAAGCNSPIGGAGGDAVTAGDAGSGPGPHDGDGGSPIGPDGGLAPGDAGPSAPDPDGGSPTPPPAGQRIIGYFTAWSVYGRDYHVPDIPADSLTHINYAFANISADGRCALGDPYADIDKFYDGDSWDAGALRGSFHQLLLLKAAHPHVRTLISVGGWTWSGRFSDVAATPAARQSFAASCVEFMTRYGFDGIDLDWEYPVSGGLDSNTTRPEDRANYTLLLRELRSQLDARGAADEAHYLLTIAAPAGPATMPNLEMAAIGDTVDWINLMTYDFHGGWDTRTGFNAPLYPASSDPDDHRLNADSAVQSYLDAGVPPTKLVLGVPFYGRGWSGVGATNDGLYQGATGLPTGTWEAGVFDYQDLVQNYLPSYGRHFDAETRVPWLYDPSTRIMISYDDPESLAIKAGYVADHGLGGVMFWELSGDDDADSLIHALAAP